MTKKLRTRIGSMLLALAMLLSLLPTAALAAETSFTDIQGHWAEAAIERWTSYGVVQGKGHGIFDPDANMTRAEMAQMYVTLLNLTEKADISKYADVPAGAWYADAVAKCVAAGILTGTSANTISPLAPVTREQMFVTFGRALGIAPLASTDAEFADFDQVSDWAKGIICALIEAGYVGGTGDNLLEPQAEINRASVVTLLDKTIAGYGNEPGSTVKAEHDNGLILVVTDDVTVTGAVDDVVVTPGAADGTVTLNGATVDGTVTVSSSDTQLHVTGKSRVKEVVITEEAEDTQVVVDKGSSVESLITEAHGTTVSGQGTVTTVEAAEGSSDVTVTTPGTKVENNSSDAVTTDKGEVKPGETGSTSKPSTGGGSSVVTTASVANYDQLKVALENANIHTITLAGDFQIPESINIPAGKTVTLDLNGHHITVPAPVDARSIYAIYNSGTLTIEDNSENADGSITARGINNNSDGKMIINGGTYIACDTNGGASVWNTGDVTINGGTFKTTHVGSSGDQYGVGCLNNSGTALVTGGTFENVNRRTYAIISTGEIEITPANGKEVNVSGAHGGLAVDSGVAVVNGGNYSSSEYYGLYVSNDGLGADPEQAAVTVNGGSFTGASYSVWIGSDYNDPVNSTIEIYGGTYLKPLNAQSNTREGAVKVFCGTFAADPSKYVVDSSHVTEENGIWTVSPITGEYEAKIGSTAYQTLAAAVNAAKDTQTVDLLKNVTTNEQIVINAGITLDGHGYTVTAGTWDDASSSAGDAHLVSVSSGEKAVVIQNITLTGAKDIGEDNGSGLNVYKSSNVTLNNVTLTNNEAAGLIVNGSTVNATGLHTSGNAWYGVNVSKGSGVTTTPDFTFDATSTFEEQIAVCGSSDAVVSAPEGWVCMELAGGKVWGKVFAGGTGTETDPYEIANIEQLKLFRDSVNLGKSYRNEYIQLTADVDLANEAWTPIGKEDMSFQGTFDGGNHTVSNLYINDSSMEHAGLFGVLNTPGSIENLTVQNAAVTAKSGAGALIGSAFTGTLANCHVTGTIQITAFYKVGGLNGGGYADITNCSVNAAEGSTVTGLYKEADLEGDNVGGLVGFLGEGDTLVSGCSVSGLTVSGTRKVAGLAGSVFTNNYVENCSVRDVTVHSNATADYVAAKSDSIGIGGLVGVFTENGNNDGHITNCTVENITLTADNTGVAMGYLLGGTRNDLPNFPDAPWYQTGNKLLGVNSGSNSALDEDVTGAYPSVVSTPEGLTAALSSGGTVQLGADIATTDELIFTEDAVLDMNGKTLTVNNGTAAVKIASGKTLTVTGSGTINGALYANNNATLVVRAEDDFQVNSDSDQGHAVYGGTGAIVDITGGIYTATREGRAINVNSMFSGTLSMKDATVTVGSASVMDSYGIYANTPEIYLENVTVNANYSRALYSNGSSHIVIRGGSFTTDKEADGFLNPTIQFSGTMEISGATITRIGIGIKKGFGSTLTASNLTFIPIGNNNTYPDTN